MFLQFISLPILSRLLSVEDFAIVALAMVVPLFANTFSDAGLGRSLVRTQTYDPVEWSSVFWFLVAVGLLLGLMVVLVAPLYARAMDEPTLLPVVLVLALVPMMQAFMAVPQAAIERSYRFDRISNLIVAAGIVSILTALILAYLGFGYWSLIAQQVVLASVRFAGFLWLSDFSPRLTLNMVKLKSHLNFGKNTLLFSGVMTVQNQAPILAFQTLFGALPVALWSMVERVGRLPRTGIVGPVSQVAMVSMSRQWREGEGAQEVSRSYFAAMRLLSTLFFPAFLLLAFNGEPAFRWFLSDPWGDVAIIFALAIPALLIDSVNSLGAQVFMVANRTDLRLRMAIERAVLGLAVIFAALPFGFEVTVAARSAFSVIYLPRYWSYLRQCVPVDTLAGIRILLLPLSMGVAAGLCFYFFIAPHMSSDLIHTVALIGVALIALGATAALSWKRLRADMSWLKQSGRVKEVSSD